MKAYW